MSNLDFSKPRQTYKELFGVEMPKEVETIVSKLCLLWNVRPDNMEITHFLITGWLQQKMVGIPEDVLSKTKEAGATICNNFKATGDAINASIADANTRLLQSTTEEARKAASARLKAAEEAFMKTATAEVKRVASEAKNLAPSQYRIMANLVLGGSVLAALVLGFFVGAYKTKSNMMDELRTTRGVNEFTSLDVKVNGQAMAGFKITDSNQIYFYPKKESADKGERPQKGEKTPPLPDK